MRVLVRRALDSVQFGPIGQAWEVERTDAASARAAAAPRLRRGVRRRVRDRRVPFADGGQLSRRRVRGAPTGGHGRSRDGRVGRGRRRPGRGPSGNPSRRTAPGRAARDGRAHGGRRSRRARCGERPTRAPRAGVARERSRRTDRGPHPLTDLPAPRRAHAELPQAPDPRVARRGVVAPGRARGRRTHAGRRPPPRVARRGGRRAPRSCVVARAGRRTLGARTGIDRRAVDPGDQERRGTRPESDRRQRHERRDRKRGADCRCVRFPRCASGHPLPTRPGRERQSAACCPSKTPADPGSGPRTSSRSWTPSPTRSGRRSATRRRTRSSARAWSGSRPLTRRRRAFVSTVSHELRTPLTSIIGYLEMLRDGDGGPINRDQGVMLEVIERNSERLLEPRRRSSRGLAPAVGEASASRSPRSPSQRSSRRPSTRWVSSPRLQHVAIVSNAGDDVGSVLGDPAQLERVTLNLVSNAVKFTPAGGRVDVDVQRDGDVVRLVVSDNGIGIPADEHHRLFTRFFRSSSAQRRSCSRHRARAVDREEVVDAHGGTVSVASRPEHGNDGDRRASDGSFGSYGSYGTTERRIGDREAEDVK